MFVLDVELIKNSYTGRVWVTKLNPAKWAGTPATDRWFRSKKDLEDDFVAGDFNHMIVFRHCGGALPFGNYLKEIVVDDPRLLIDGVDAYSAAFGALTSALTDAGLDAPLTKRRCKHNCRCSTSYADAMDTTTGMFIPNV
jgi:hypothetical protein